MREVKFRGMDVNGKWHIGNLAIIKMLFPNLPPCGCYISDPLGVPFAYSVRPETVGQYTGLKDRDDQEIYDGDIIEFDTTEIGGEKCKAEIFWCDDFTIVPCPGWGLWHIGPNNGYSPAGFELLSCKIIGNKFENDD